MDAGKWRRRLPLILTVLLTVASTTASPAPAQRPPRSENVVLIVTDGLRWQELVRGADSALINQRYGGVDDTAGIRRTFWRPVPAQARQALLPFLWTTIATDGRIFGDPDDGGAPAAVTNGLKFSYPGYNEMLTGRADPRIDRNDFGPNPNVTIFERLAALPAFHDRVAAFGTWDVFAAIFNRQRAGFPVHAGWEPPFATDTSATERTINRLYATTTRLWDDELAYDGFMQAAVLDYVATQKPRLLFVGYGETDEWAHSRRYDQVLRSARRVDEFVAELWRTMQAMPQYRDHTTFIITTDHGRGGTLTDWTDHGRTVAGAEKIWIAVMGPDVTQTGTSAPAVTQSQIAATVGALLGPDYATLLPDAAAPLPGVFLPRAESRR